MRIDPHVHFRDWEQGFKETVAHGLALAGEQGVDCVFDMPNTQPPIISEEDVARRLELVPEKDKQRYFLYVGATANENQLTKAARLVESSREVIGIKMYAGKSVGDLQIINEDEQKKVYSVLSDAGYSGVLAVHCEKEKHVKNVFDPNDAFSHALARPKICEIESVKDQVRFAEETGFQGTLHVCHVSCRESVDLIDAARKEIKITCGATPHHLLWSDEMLKGPKGLLYKMNPSLRSQEDVKALQECLGQGKIDWIETDHAPHTVGEKLHAGYPSGYPSLYLYKSFVEQFLPGLGLTKKQISDMTFNNIVKVFGLDI
jgi:dihydroorotase